MVFILTFVICCNKLIDRSTQSSNNVLARVGDKIITVNDYIKRCEYVPRPRYCNSNNYIHKKIALNSLIADKLLALEFEKLNYLTTENQKHLILGQKEQAMRQLMLKRFGYDLVKIDTNKVKNLAKLRNRKYELIFFVINKKHEQLLEKNPNNTTLNKFIKELNGDIEINSKTITKDDTILKEVEEILFFGNQNLNILYGPFNADSENILFFEIKGWSSGVDITEKQKKESWETAKDMFTERAAKQVYSNYVSKIMKGKTINYSPGVFERFSNKIAKIYLIEKDKKEAAIENRIWERKEKTNHISFDDIRAMNNNIVLTHDKKKYTVADLLGLIKIHPLVFRNKTVKPSMFLNELKYAVADLFRDIHITEKAYALNINRDTDVINTEKKWGDYIKSGVLKGGPGFGLSSKKTPSKALTAKIDSLQNYYSSIITIDTDKFEKISLSTIDMSVIYSNQPYARLEPDFPILTDDHILDYGKKVVFNE